MRTMTRICALLLGMAVACSYDASQLAGPPTANMDSSAVEIDGPGLSPVDTAVGIADGSSDGAGHVTLDVAVTPDVPIASGGVSGSGDAGENDGVGPADARGAGGVVGSGGIIGAGGSTVVPAAGGTGGHSGTGGISSAGGTVGVGGGTGKGGDTSTGGVRGLPEPGPEPAPEPGPEPPTDGGSVAACANAIPVSGGHLSIGTTNAFCFVTCDTIQFGWGCNSFTSVDRVVKVNGTSVTCGGTLPAKKSGYYYFEIGAGGETWDSISWSGAAATTCTAPSGGFVP